MLNDKLLRRHLGAIATLAIISLLSSWNGLPSQHEISNSWDGFLWGMADPVLGLDRLVSIVAIGLLAAGTVCSSWIVIAFPLANILGTIIHLLEINLPVTEIAIAVLTIGFGIMLVVLKRANLFTLLMLTAIAGLFQGYFNGTSIVEAATIPSVAYIVAATLTEYTVIMTAKEIGTQVRQGELSGFLPRTMSLIGFAICALGIVSLRTWLN